jgi:phenylacetate-CoA ligase
MRIVAMLTGEQQFISRLQRTQWLSPEELTHYQQPLIERLVRHAATQTQYYADRLSALFDGADRGSAAIELSRWQEVPILTRDQIVANAWQMKAREVPAETGGIVTGRSSGTTNLPLEHQRSSAADTASNCQLDRVFELFEFDLAAPFAFIVHDAEGRCSYPDGLQAKGWNRTEPEAKLSILEIRTPAIDQLNWLEREKPSYVMTYPNNLRAIAEAARDRGGSPLRFDAFVASGEVLTEETREIVKSVFGCRTVDVYASREVGQIAFQCPDDANFHICSELVLCELLDEQGREVNAGEFGRVVVTSLYNYAMPFIRYDLGDVAKRSRVSCTCGRGLPSVERIGGRVRHLYTKRDGSREWPPLGPISKTLSKVLLYRQIQFIQSSIETIEIKYVPIDRGKPPDLTAVQDVMKKELDPNIQIRLIAVDRIERGAGMKIEQFISRVSK